MSYSTSTEFHSFENVGFLLTVHEPDFINALVHKMQFYARFHMQNVIVFKYTFLGSKNHFIRAVLDKVKVAQ